MSRCWWVALALGVAGCGQPAGGSSAQAPQPDSCFGSPEGESDAGTRSPVPGDPLDGGPNDPGSDGGTVACTPEPGPAAANCSELVPDPIGPPQAYRYRPTQGFCGLRTGANGEGAFVQVERPGIGWDDKLNFVSPTGEITARIPQTAVAWAMPTATGFLGFRYFPDGTRIASSHAWYTSTGVQMGTTVVVRQPSWVVAQAMRPDGKELAIVVSAEDGSSGFELRFFDTARTLEAAGSVVLPDSAGLLGQVWVVFDATGNVLVAFC